MGDHYLLESDISRIPGSFSSTQGDRSRRAAALRPLPPMRMLMRSGDPTGSQAGGCYAQKGKGRFLPDGVELSKSASPAAPPSASRFIWPK